VILRWRKSDKSSRGSTDSRRRRPLTTTCASGYCRYDRNDSRLVPISTTAYLEDQAGGAVFAGGWSIAAQTIALGVLRGAVTMRPRRGRFF